jgi:dTDP-4-dehydrorhamnose reductase
MPFSSFEFIDPSKPIVIFGRDGQVGKALQECLKDSRVPVVFLSRSDCDMRDEASIAQVLKQYQPQVIINAAAYTAVDKAESEPDLAFAINARAPKVMARYLAKQSRAVLIHYSTDYVFADTKKTPYLETDEPGPAEQLSVYGQSKLAGEQLIQKEFNLAQNLGDVAHPDIFSRYFILRTSWVYGDGGNFIRTMLRLAGELDQLKVVNDQIGVPSSAAWLAELGVQVAGSRLDSGIYHAVPDGETSWHGLALFAIETAVGEGEGIEVKPEHILPIAAVEYPLPAKRPYNSRLSNQKLKQALSQMAYTSDYPHWQDQVELYVKDYVNSSLKS